MTNSIIKSYKELILLPTFEERFNYLKLNSSIGIDTFGFDRYLNQNLYTSSEWRKFRKEIILRDRGCDLGVDGYDIFNYAVIHHINPITVDDVVNHSDCLFDPNNAITCTSQTHRLIHYGAQSPKHESVIERSPNDTCPWKV